MVKGLSGEAAALKKGKRSWNFLDSLSSNCPLSVFGGGGRIFSGVMMT